MISALLEFDKNLFLALFFLQADVKIGTFPFPTAYRSGFGIFKQNVDNPDEIGMVGQSVFVKMGVMW